MARIDRNETANNVIWHEIMKEFIDYVSNNPAYTYNDILDIQKPLSNIQEVPNDGLKYFVRHNEDNKRINAIYSKDASDVLTLEYTPVYKDRIIWADSADAKNYIFQDLTLEPGAEAQIVQREESKKYNNSFLGDFGISIYEGVDQAFINTTSAPAINFLLSGETNVPKWNRVNQPKSINKTITFKTVLFTTGTDLNDDPTPYTSLADLQLQEAYLWGIFLQYGRKESGEANRIQDIVTNNNMYNEVAYKPSIMYEMNQTIKYI